jgi:hypothetical protein
MSKVPLVVSEIGDIAAINEFKPGVMQRMPDVVHAIFCIAALVFPSGSRRALPSRSLALLGHGFDLLQSRLDCVQMIARSLRAFLHPLGERNGLAIPNVLREPKIDVDDVVRVHGGIRCKRCAYAINASALCFGPGSIRNWHIDQAAPGYRAAAGIKLFR